MNQQQARQLFISNYGFDPDEVMLQVFIESYIRTGIKQGIVLEEARNEKEENSHMQGLWQSH